MFDDTTLLTILSSKYSDKSKEELEIIIKQIILKISQYIGVPIFPTSFTQIEKNFKGESLIVDTYPIYDIHSLTIEGKKLHEHKEFNLDKNAGLIYFKDYHEGFLKLEYTACLNDSQCELYINPLVLDMVDYELDMGWTKNASSISEGDVSISLDTSIGKGTLIQSKLDDLKILFNSNCRMI